MKNHEVKASHTYHSVAGLAKGLRLLNRLAMHGESSAQELAVSTGIPRPTVHRLLATLIEAGYVGQEVRGQGYRLTSAVKTLADGYKEDDWLFSASTPVLEQLRQQVSWPTDVALCLGGWMVVCASTHDMNPLSLDRVVRGRRIALLTSSLGRAYLAFCPEKERDALLQSLRPHSELERQHLASLELFRHELHQTRERGYALRIKGSQPKTCSIAVPVMYQDWVVACINIHWIARALKTDTAIERYLQPLQSAAKELAHAYALQAER